MEETHGIPKKSILTEGVVLATVPIIAYYSAYQYEVGYYRAFGAPENLISVNISTIIEFGSVTLGIIFVLYSVIDMLWHSRLDRLLEMSWRQTITSLLLMFLILWLLFGFLYQSVFKSAFIPACIVSMLFLFRLGKIVYPKWLFFFVILVLLLGNICQGIGQYNAKTQTKFTIIENTKNTFVIRKLGDYFLCSTYDANARTYVKSFRVIPIKDKGLSLEYKDIGPLHSSP